MELTIDQALQQGVASHREGKLQDAERIYRAILQAQPKHPDANHNLGVLAVAVGKPLEAIPLFKLALETNPQIEQFWLSYVGALIKLERFEEAKRVLVEGEKSSVPSEKLEFLQQQIPKSPPRKGNKLIKQGLTLSEKRKKLAERKKSRETEARSSSPRAEPPQDQLNDLLEHYQAGRLEEAEALAALLTQQFPKHPFGWKALGLVFNQTGRLNKSLLPMQEAADLSPQDSEAHNNLGNTLKKLGRLDDAEASFRKAIALKPDFAEAHSNLANMKKFSSQDEQCLQMQALYRDPSTSEKNRCQICFALAKAYEDLRELARAFQLYSEGNALRKKELGYNTAQDEQLFEILKANYQQISDAGAPEIVATEHAPIFIVGMPRSGTTLVEQIISSHPLVAGAGELPFVAQLGASLAVGQSPADSKALATFREEYLSALKQRSEGNAIITDKMPQNFRFLGLIATALPEAKIIHVKRDPAAVCWANYTQYFVNDSLGYCYSLDDILHYHELYQDLMKYWRLMLPNRIYDLDYDGLTENQEEETRKLIDHLGLEWDDACLSPQDNTRGVATASNVQVRRKVYQGSSEKWKRYKPFLNGALDQLSADNK